MILFTADDHFFHENVIEYCNRPFPNLESMHTELIDNWNTTVSDKDTVYHHGDFCLSGAEDAQSIFCQLNGQINFLTIDWHHDKRWLSKRSMYDTQGDTITYHTKHYPVKFLPPLFILKIPEIDLNGRPMWITCSHYPLESWEKSFHGAWHLHAHSHGMLAPMLNRLDIGVDSQNYTPVSLPDVINYFTNIQHELL